MTRPKLSTTRTRALVFSTVLAWGAAGSGCVGVLEDAPAGPRMHGPPPGPSADPIGARIWHLTPRQYDRTVHALFPTAPAAERALRGLLPPAERRFENESNHRDMTTPYVGALFDRTEATAAMVGASPGVLAPCLEGGVPTDPADARACLTTAFDVLLAQAWRRPATDDEVSRFVDHVLARRETIGSEAAIADAVQGVLLSPSFLFRTELGSDDAPGDVVELDAFESASALAYFLLDGPPDDTLLDAAASGELDEPDALERHARRLLATPAGAHGLLRFVAEQTGAAAVTETAKSSEIYPEFSPELAADMEREVGEFVAYVLENDDARFETLMSASYSVVSPRLATFYGVESPGDGWSFVELPESQRAGLLTLPAVLASHGRDDRGDPILRGKFIRERMLCTPIAFPDFVPELPDDGDPGPEVGRTMRERLAEHTSRPECQGCHRLMDPLGLPLERYDGIGRFRTHEGAFEIDPSGELVGYGDAIAYEDAIAMTAVLAVHPQAEDCFVQSLFHYAYGRPAGEGDGAELTRLRDAFQASSGNVIELVVDIVGSPHFVDRRRAR